MSTDTAYRTADPEVVAEWQRYERRMREVNEARDALSESVGRRLYVSRGFGHGTRVVGFECFDSDVPGETMLDGSLRVMKNERIVKPNLRTKRGKSMDEQMRQLTTPNLKLPGMPAFHLYGDDDGMRSASPALWMGDGIVYALWPCDNAPVKDNWETIPLSTYYLAREQYDKEHADANEG